MKVCFIGSCGHWRRSLKTLKERDDIEFCGFAPGSREEERTESIDEAIPFYENYEAMLEETRPELAVVAPVFGITGRIILACARRGIHVFAEKPVASSLAELEQVKEAVLESGIRFCAMHELRFTPAFYRGARLVHEGRIGKVKMITAQKSYVYGVRPQWYADPALYGGTIPWVGIHAIDWIAHFSGKRFLRVTACSVGKNPEMAALCQFALEDGVIASANLDFYRPETAPSHGDDRVRCVGTEGVLEVRDGKILLMSSDGVTEETPTEAPNLLNSFLEGICLISPEEIFHLTETAIAAREAAKSGEGIQIGGLS